jgi:hypothetical protein
MVSAVTIFMVRLSSAVYSGGEQRGFKGYRKSQRGGRPVALMRLSRMTSKALATARCYPGSGLRAAPVRLAPLIVQLIMGAKFE